MRINNNLMAMNAHRQLGKAQNMTSKHMERLSSGFRINRAGDDAAGLAISEKMRAQIRGLNQASRNSQDAISLIQTAEGALDEAHSILQRMRELSVQAANDTNVEVDREEIQKEIIQLTSELNRIGNTTEFNTMNLLDGSQSSARVTGETYVGTIDQEISLALAQGISGDLELKDKEITITAGNHGVDWENINTSGSSGFLIVAASGNYLTVTISGVLDQSGNTLDVSDVIDISSLWENGEFTYNNHGISFTLEQSEWADNDGESISFDLTSFHGSSGALDITGTMAASSDFATLSGSGAINFSDISVDGGRLNAEFGNAVAQSLTIEYDGSGTFVVTIYDAASGGNALSTDTYFVSGQIDSDYVFEYNEHGISFNIAFSDSGFVFETNRIEIEDGDINKTEDSSLNFQIGANQDQRLNLSIEDMRAVALQVSAGGGGAGEQTVTLQDGSTVQAWFRDAMEVTDGTQAKETEYALDVTSHQKAEAAVTVINDSIERVSAERSKLGAAQNRLESTIKNLDNVAENLQAAESRIRDVDMAAEMMQFTRQNILQQASISMLAQANLAPQSVLQLLG